jgi:hypothetical protein
LSCRALISLAPARLQAAAAARMKGQPAKQDEAAAAQALMCVTTAAASSSPQASRDGSAFATFSHAYDSSEAPEHAFQLMTNVHNFIIAACRKYGASEQAARAYFNQLQAEVFQLKDMTLKTLALQLWVSISRLELAPGRHIEFCSLVNRMLRECDPELLPCGCSVVRGINLLFNQNDDPNAHPPGSKLHRGGALPLQHLPFFTAGKKFRVPMYYATTLHENTAHA